MNTQEYNECVKQHSDAIFRFIVKNLGDAHEAENIVQNTYEKLWIKREAVHMETAKAYLFKVAYNNMIDVIRKNKRTTDLEQAGQVEAETHHYSDMIEWVKKAANELPEKQKTALTLRDFEGYDYKSIGEITGMNESQVKVNIFRARKYIKEYIQKLEAMVL
ncbi:RNA polymerase sigma factor [bacterium]|nr:RNA polymerase sigma factor [bacterium]